MKKGTEKIEKEKKVRKKLKLGKKGKVILCIILVIAVALAGFGIYKWRKSKKTGAELENGTSIVRSGNLTNSISGSGSVEPIEQRDIVPVVKGEIIEAPFNEGDEVKKGDILYRFEMTAATNAIETAENNVEKAQTNLSNRKSNLSKAQENIDELTIAATASGKIDGLSLLVGEETAGMICTITNYKEQTVTLPFNSSKVGEIQVGDSATVAVDKYMMNTSGKVTRKYTTPSTLSSGALVYNVEILLDDTYILEEGVSVTATVNGITSASYGNVKYASPVTVNASQKGEVKKVNYKNGDWVDKGDVIAVLENTDLNDELRNAQQAVNEAQMNLTEAENTLEDRQEEANEYILESPIDGVILTKDYEVGDTISGQTSTVMMVVADMSKMKFTISADELDISKIKLGQSVSVTADALTGQRLMGRITNISKLGTSSNGVTNYPIEVTIDQPGDLMPGMNVNANIIIEQSFDTLYLPLEAVEYFGGKYYVTIVGEVENMPEREKMSTGGQWGQRPEEIPEGETEENTEQKPKAKGDSGEKLQSGSSGGNSGENRQGKEKQQEELKIKYYAKEKRVEVEIGISTDTYYEIKSGVEYGQVVKNTTQASSSSRGGFGMMGGMPGGMNGGMSGGMGGNRAMSSDSMGGTGSTGNNRGAGGR